MTPERSNAPWMEPGWIESVRAWLDETACRLGFRIDGPIEQPHVRLWSTVLRVPTTHGTLFFKACAPVLAHEVAVTQAMTTWRGDCLPTILASEPERGWMLMADGGKTVREFTKADGDIRHWLRMVPEYARLQIDVAPHIETLVSLGLPDRRLAVLPERVADLLTQRDMLRLGQDDGITQPELERLEAMNTEIVAMCERLAAYGIPESIHHGDFHDANAFLQGDRYLFFDWGDSSASHPFVSLRTSFVCIEYILDLEEDAAEFDVLRDTYLKAWGACGAHEDLVAAFDLANCLSSLVSALSWNRTVSSLPKSQRGDAVGAVPALLREFLERVDRLNGRLG